MLPCRTAALFLSLFLVISARAAEPITFHEISLYVRSGQTAENIFTETARRKLLLPLTAEQEVALRDQGASKALLDHNPSPSESEIRYWLAGNLCRCTGYDKIVRAVQDAAAELRQERTAA